MLCFGSLAKELVTFVLISWIRMCSFIVSQYVLSGAVSKSGIGAQLMCSIAVFSHVKLYSFTVCF